MSGAAAPHTFTGVVAGAFRRAPLRAKTTIVVSILYVVGIAVWVVLSQPDRLTGTSLYGGILAGASGILLGTAVTLSRAAQDEGCNPRFSWGVTPRRMTDMLLALPILAFCSGAMAAAGMMVVLPSARRQPVLFLPVAGLVYVTLASAKLLSDATRYLYFHAREQADAAERARAEASDAQLAALQAQVNPHFLFNALNTIAALVRTNPRAAEATTENLAAVLRRTLDRTRRVDCTVDDEIDFLRAWLAVERERYGDRLRVDFFVDAAAGAFRIPTMTLQPLVENSLKHGIAGKLEGGRVIVRVRREDGRLRMEVEDDGAGFPRDPREGTGLGNLRRRLETIYAADAALTIDRPPAGARVVVEVPARS